MSSTHVGNIRRATQATVDTFHIVKKQLRVGMSEKEIADLVKRVLSDQGSQQLAFPTIAALGSGAAEPHHVPTDRKAKKGDMLVLDMGGVIGGMRADMTRTLFFGEPTAQHRTWYEDVLEAQKRAFRGVRAGRSGQSIDFIARRYLDAAGYEGHFIHALGHGLGAAIHQRPWVGPSKRSENILKNGVVITIEPGVYYAGKGGVRIEDACIVGVDKATWVVPQQRHISRMIIA